MTKRKSKRAVCLTLTVLFSAVFLAIPILIACGQIDRPVTNSKEDCGLEQHRSRAPSEEKQVNLDLPEQLLDIERDSVNRGISPQDINKEKENSQITQTDDITEFKVSRKQSPRIFQVEEDKVMQDLPIDPLLKAAVKDGNAHASSILENELMWNMIENSDEASDYYNNLNNNKETATTENTVSTKTTESKNGNQVTTKASTSTTTSTSAQTTTTTSTTTKASLKAEPKTKTKKSSQALINISHPDPNYHGGIVRVEDRAYLEGLVMGEFGNDYIGSALVAQTIRDTMLLTGIRNTRRIAREWGYHAPIRSYVSENTRRAVSFVFDQGGYVVQHPLYYFYAAHIVRSNWHETQKFIIQYGGCRFFSRW